MFPVTKLASETLPEQYNPSLFNFFYETFPQGFIVAEKAREIIGFIVGVKTNPENLKILMLSVSKSHRKQSIGSELLKRFLKEVKNAKQIELEVRTDNKEAIHFYQKHGFEITDKIANFYQNNEDAFTMKKCL
jgi:ribosomal-protein-alanine acetyltransferase